jgi:integration host factor subunit beta
MLLPSASFKSVTGAAVAQPIVFDETVLRRGLQHHLFCRLMNRSDLVPLLAQRFAHLTHDDVELAVDAILGAMNEALARGHRIEVRGFGSFTVVHRAARVGRNPRTGDPVLVPQRRVPMFKVGKSLRAALECEAPGDLSAAQIKASDQSTLTTLPSRPRATP